MSDYYCKCKTCKYVDPNSRSGYKWYCEYYRTYEDPDNVRECSHYVRGVEESSGCFLTEACCRAHDLPDDCRELTTLRQFRDQVLLPDDQGNRMVKQYYAIAPSIVEQIDLREDRAEIYERIYSYIEAILPLIELGNTEQAIITYLTMIVDVQSRLLHIPS